MNAKVAAAEEDGATRPTSDESSTCKSSIEIPESRLSTLRSGLVPTGPWLTPISPDVSVKASEPRDMKLPPAVEPDDNQWRVEALIQRRVRYHRKKRLVEYRVRWEGYGSEDDEWVLEEDIHPSLTKTYKGNDVVNEPPPRRRGRPRKSPATAKRNGPNLALEIPSGEPPKKLKKASYRSPRVLNQKMSIKEDVTSEVVTAKPTCRPPRLAKN